MDARGIERTLADALARLPAASYRVLAARARAAAFELGVTYQYSADRIEATDLVLAPMVASSADLAAVGTIALRMTGVLRRLPALRAALPAVRDLLPLEAGEEDWFADCWVDGHAAAGGIISRWDFNVERLGGGRRRIRIFEGNGVAVGGLNYGFAAERITVGLLPELEQLAGRRLPRLRPLVELHEALFRFFRAHAARLGRRLRTLVWLEDRTWDAGITEAEYLVEAFRRRGVWARVADPRDLRLVRDEVCCGGRPVDVVYRNMELRDLTAIEREGGRLRALREAFRRNQVLSSLAGDVDHKSVLEVVVRPEVLARLSPAQRNDVRSCVPWTRLVRAAKCDAPDGRTVDLPGWIRRRRTSLVLKPNRECGGDGVTIGRVTPQAAWERVLERALRERRRWVVQEYIPAVRIPVPLERRGRVAVHRRWANWGIVAFPGAVGILGRASDDPVVNVSRGGGIVAVLRPRGRG